MEGGISLKEFILGVKEELLNASAEGSKNPYLELNNVELEAEFELDLTGGVGGGLGIFVKAKIEGSAKQSHKVKLIFSPIKTASGDGTVYYLEPPFYKVSPATPTTPVEPLVDPISGSANNPGPLHQPWRFGTKVPGYRLPGVQFYGTEVYGTKSSKTQFSGFSNALKLEIDEIVKKALSESNQSFNLKKGGILGSGEGGD